MVDFCPFLEAMGNLMVLMVGQKSPPARGRVPVECNSRQCYRQKGIIYLPYREGGYFGSALLSASTISHPGPRKTNLGQGILDPYHIGCTPNI